jgi:TPR repeat protein
MKYILLLTALLSSGVFASEFDETKALAEQGHAAAQHNLGVMYTTGEGVPENDTEAVKWYRKAAEQGNVSAQNNLGAMYAQGDGVPENDAEAVKW